MISRKAWASKIGLNNMLNKVAMRTFMHLQNKAERWSVRGRTQLRYTQEALWSARV
jgi:hypothetical protein